MNEVMTYLMQAWEWMLLATLAACPVAALVAAVDLSLGRIMAAKYRVCLWLIIIVRVMIPPGTVAPTGPLSIYAWRLFDETGAAPTAVHSIADLYRNESAVATTASSAVDSPDSWEAVHSGDARPLSVPPTGHQAAASAIATPDNTVNSELRIELLLASIWFVVGTLLLMRHVVASLRFAWRIRAASEIHDQPTIDILLRACDAMGVGRRPRLVELPGLCSPVLFGCRRPTLCLPDTARQQLDQHQLSLVMMHELAHLRRRDAWLAWPLALIQAIHWCHPLVWLARRRIAVLTELACDEAVTTVRPRSRRHYADLLLQFVQPQPGKTTTITLMPGLPMASGHRQIKSRITRIMSRTRFPFARASLSVLVAATVGCIGLTDPAALPAPAAPLKQPDFRWTSTSEPAATVRQTHDVTAVIAATVRQTHDVTAVISAHRQHTSVVDAGAEAGAVVDSWLTLALAAAAPKSTTEPTDVWSTEHWQREGNQVHLTATPREHRRFARQLQSIAKSGLWQVSLSISVLSGPQRMSSQIGIDWQQANHSGETLSADFALQSATELPDTPGDDQIRIASAVRSHAFAPRVAIRLTAETRQRLIDVCQGLTRVNVAQTPKITVFSGGEAQCSDQSFRPFVVDVAPVRGEFGFAHQPKIAVLPEGMRIRVRPTVLSPPDKLELSCEIVEASIGETNTVDLPGGRYDQQGKHIEGTVVQSPQGKHEVTSLSCRLSVGESVLIASPGRDQSGDGRLTLYLISAEWMPM